MNQPSLRLLIQEKLADGRLPRDHVPSIRRRQGHGETCDGCEGTVTQAQILLVPLRASLHIPAVHAPIAEVPTARVLAFTTLGGIHEFKRKPTT